VVQAVSCRSGTAEAGFQSQVIPCGICGERSGTGIGLSLNTWVSAIRVGFVVNEVALG
jgi:hypothetical protein